MGVEGVGVERWGWKEDGGVKGIGGEKGRGGRGERRGRGGGKGREEGRGERAREIFDLIMINSLFQCFILSSPIRI